jgi:tetratricopeptide (TPR) repeat protein
LAKVTKDTQLFESLAALRKTIQEKADKRAREAYALMEQKQIDQAKAITDDVLVAIPNHRDAKTINEDAARRIAIRDAPPPPPPTKAKVEPWDMAVERYRDGDLNGAKAMASACSAKAPQCRTLMGLLTDFENLYKKVEELDVKGLSRLMDLDKKITNGRSSKLIGNAGKRAANLFYKAAASAKVSGQWGRAMEQAQRALQADPSHVGAAAIVTEMRGKAKDVYLSAYAIKDTSPEDALPKFRDVVNMTQPDDEFHEKAKFWIGKLQR